MSLAPWTLGALLSPIFLWGAALFAVPLIIHLLHRRRYRTVTWAAMDFVLSAYKKKSRRMRLENLLLLLLRCAIPVILALAMARPFFGSDNPLSLVADARREVVVVLDTSYSMNRRIEAGTVYQAALSQVRRLFDLLDPGNGDTCMLVTLAERPRVVLGRSAVRGEWESALERLAEPSFQSADLTRTMELLEQEVLPQIPSEAEVFVFTDLQRNTFEPALRPDRGESEQGNSSIESRLRRLERQGRTFHFVNLCDGRVAADNSTVLELRAAEPVAIVDQNLRISATIWREAGPVTAGRVGGLFRMGGTERVVSLEFDRDGKAVAEMYHSFSTAGDHTVEFRLDDDDLLTDNSRFLRVPVRDGIPILIVDGDPQGDETEGAAGTLLTVLDPLYGDDLGDAGLQPYFRPEVLPYHMFNQGRVRLDDYEAVFLVNVRELDEERTVPALTQYVRQGGGVCFFLGEQVLPASYNERLYRPDGTGLMPFPLHTRTTGEPNTLRARASLGNFYRLRIADELHPAIRTFVDERLRRYLGSPIFCFLPFDLDAPAPEGLRVPLELGENGDYGLVDHQLGRGHALWFVSSITRDWSLFAETANAYFPFYWDLAHYLTRGDPSAYQLEVGESIRRSIGVAPTAFTVTKPGGEVRTVREISVEPVDGRYPLPPFDETEVPGAYVLDLPLDTGAPLREVYAVNVDPAEGELQSLDREGLATLLDPDLYEYLLEISSDASESAVERQGEIWKALLIALLAALLLETVLAWRFGAYG